MRNFYYTYLIKTTILLYQGAKQSLIVLTNPLKKTQQSTLYVFSCISFHNHLVSPTFGKHLGPFSPQLIAQARPFRPFVRSHVISGCLPAQDPLSSNTKRVVFTNIYHMVGVTEFSKPPAQGRLCVLVVDAGVALVRRRWFLKSFGGGNYESGVHVFLYYCPDRGSRCRITDAGWLE